MIRKNEIGDLSGSKQDNFCFETDGIHTFTPIVNVNDVNDIQIASTFRY